MNSRLVAIPVLALFQAMSAHAQTATSLERLLALSLDDLLSLKVKISTNTDKPLGKAPSVVSVITAEDIRATGASNLVEILQSVPGIYVRANLFGFRPHVTFRGAAGTHTLLMVNGVPVKDLVWASGIFWKGLPTSMIERVEIIRGPGSALFGSDASAGVINVITRTASSIEQSEAGLRLGSFDSQSAWVRHGAKWNGYEIGLTADLSHTGGHDPTISVDGQTRADAAYGTQVSHAPGHARYGWRGHDLRLAIAKDNWRLQADSIGHDDLQIGLTGAGVLDPSTQAKDSRHDLALLYDNPSFAEHWALDAELRYHHLEYSSGEGFFERPPGYRDASGLYADGVRNLMRAAERGASFEISGLYSGFDQHAIRLGAGYNWEDLYRVEQWINQGTGPDGNPLPAGGPLVDVSDTPYAFAPEKDRRIAYAYLQDIWTLAENWEMTAGVRYDHYSDFGRAVTPRLALLWQSTPRLTTKLIYGEAFRAPSYLELYAQTSATLPNPDLTPERSKTWDLALAYSASENLKLGMDIYRFAQSNLIASDASNQFQNIGNRTTHGIELEAQWQANKQLRLSGNLSFSNEDDTPYRSYSIPEQKAYLRADWAFKPRWNWNLQANWIGERALPAGDPRQPLPAYTLVDTTLRHFHPADWEFAVSIRNLFDADGREYSSRALTDNLPLPGRTLYAEWIYKF